MRFAAPDSLWLLLAMPLLALFAIWAAAARRRILVRFTGGETAARLTDSVSSRRQNWKYALLLSGMLFLVLALSGPQFGAELAMAQRRGVDVVVAFDVSRSMLAEDLKPNRLERAKYQIGQLVDRLEGDRVGLVVLRRVRPSCSVRSRWITEHFACCCRRSTPAVSPFRAPP